MMRRYYEWLLSHPKRILVLFGLLAVLGLVVRPLVRVNYNIADYLSKDTPSTSAVERMREAYDEGVPNARVMVKGVSVAQALSVKARIQACAGVRSVLWLDDAADILQPIEMMDREVVESYYREGDALFSVTISEGCLVEATDAIRGIIGSDGMMEGDAVTLAVATTSTVDEVRLIVIFSILFVAFILILTTASWIEPLIILVGLGVAIAINAGTNLIFGEISFITDAAGNILQLAVSLDYAVFLIHRYHECLSEFTDPDIAMIEALMRSSKSILASGLTTLIGFIALIFMRFGIGSDLGFALAKGIGISMITVFSFVPVFTLSMHRWIVRGLHRPLLPGFDWIGRLVNRWMRPMLVGFVLSIVPGFLASNANTFTYGASKIFGEQTQLGRDKAAIAERFGLRDIYVLLVPKQDRGKAAKLSEKLHELEALERLISYVDRVGVSIPAEYLDDAVRSRLESEHYTRFVLTLDTPYEGASTFRLIERIRSIAEDIYGEDWHLAGEGVVTYDLMDTITSDMLKVNLIAIAAIAIVLMFSLRSAVLPIILVLCIETAIRLNIAVPYFADRPVYYIAYLIITSIQLGATVDYAILFTDRYIGLRKELPKRQAVERTVGVVMPSLMSSGIVLSVVGFLMGAISSHGILAQIGQFLGVGTLMSLLIVLFVLPGWLCLADRHIVKRFGVNWEEG